MSFPDVFQVVLFAVASAAIIGAVLYVVTCVVLIVALAIKELWYRARYGRKK